QAAATLLRRALDAAPDDLVLGAQLAATLVEAGRARGGGAPPRPPAARRPPPRPAAAAPPPRPVLPPPPRPPPAAAVPARRRRGEAIDHLRRCLELTPDDDVAANDLAWLLGERPTTAAAGADLAKKVTARAPGNAGFWDTRAVCSAAAGDEGDAVGSWKRAAD